MTRVDDIISKYNLKSSSAPTTSGTDLVRQQNSLSGQALVDSLGVSSGKEQRYTENAKETGATFPANPNPTIADVPVEALKAVGNVPSSAVNLSKGAVQALNPVNTAKTIQTGGEGFQGLINETGSVPKARQALAESGVEMGKRFIEGIKNLTPDKVAEWLHKTSVNDPLLIPTLVEQGASALGKGKELEAVIGKVTKPVADVMEAGVGKVKGGVESTAKFGISQATGLSPNTLKTVSEQPAAFSNAKMAEVSRPKLGEKVHEGIQTKIDELGETGKAYQPIRDSGQTVVVDPKKLTEVFDKYGIKFDENGKIVRSKDTVPMKSGDMTALEDFFSIYGKDSYYDSNSFLNARKALSNLGEYDTAKSDVSNKIARELRKVYDVEGKSQVTGLAELDAKYAPQVKEFTQIKKDYLTKDIQSGDWRLKDGAANKIANLTGKGKEQILARLEEINPGITEDINILKAVEDIQGAEGQKVGTYGRAALGAGGLATGNIPAIIASVLAQPKIALQLIRTYGEANIRSKSMIDKIIRAVKEGKKLTGPQQDLFKKAILAGKAEQKTGNN